MILFSVADAFDDQGTPDDFSDTIAGTPLDCKLRDSISGGVVATGASVTDCTITSTDESLQVSNWLTMGSPSIEGSSTSARPTTRATSAATSPPTRTSRSTTKRN